MDKLMLAIVAVTGALLLVQIGMIWRLLDLRRSMTRHEEKLGHLSDALSLLTETTESGFRSVADELERLAGTAVKRPSSTPRATNARVTAAARRGRTVQEIAAAERRSEGEVRLRLHLADPAQPGRAHEAAPRKRNRRERADGAV
jgi:hypothetical protein